MNIVTLGGGTGQYHTLRALMYLKTQLYTGTEPIRLSAIPTTTDNGGSSGILRFDYNIVAPGDIGQCILGLHPKPEEVAWLFAHRFTGGGLHGHTTRNIIVTTALQEFGPTQAALDAIRDMFKLEGDVCPATFSESHVHVQLKSGKVLVCEDELYRKDILSEGGVERIWLEPEVQCNARAVETIRCADVIIVCPGTLYCSIIPNFLVHELKNALCESSAIKIYVANLMNQKGHIPNHWTAIDHMKCINNYLHEDFFDIVIVNAQEPSHNQALMYGNEKVYVSCTEQSDNLRCTIISGPLLMNEPSVKKDASGDMLAHLRASVRHDKKRLANALQNALFHSTVHVQ